ncbi:hypothetical protein DFH07DRAFT_979118 [Mycena maculata]|uniref:F-box domain-containing protein n=1 Tax=Mycena maculata TaxID=230809 RepID=A0AAD7K2F6_9AGAR|nr:hypothetical protein DFH07DRAFT_979118 [Mycena maculata]
MSSRVPNELWLEIFQHLPTDTLKNLALTYHRFQILSRSFIFASFTFHPYGIYTDEYRENPPLLLPPAAAVASYLERLDFWTSDEIAPLVRSCRVDPWYAWRRGDCVPTPTPYLLRDAFFARLGRFSLERLHAKTLHFTRAGLAALCGLSLHHLGLEMCSFPTGDPGRASLALSIPSFTFQTNWHPPFAAASWVPRLRPDRLRVLQISADPAFLGDLVHDAFPRVQRLALTLDPAHMPLNLAFLAKFPGVQVFRMDAYHRTEGPLPPMQGAGIGPALPALKEYRGTYQALPAFLALPTLARVVTSCSAAHLAAALHARPPTSVTALHLELDNFDAAALDPICAVFPRLLELRIKITFAVAGDEHAIPSLFRGLAAAPRVPPGLACLVLECTFAYPDGAGAVPGLPAVRDALVARCPRLTSLWIDGHNFLLQWRKAPDGTLHERALDDVVRLHQPGAGGVPANLGTWLVIRREAVAAFWDTR